MAKDDHSSTADDGDTGAELERGVGEFFDKTVNRGGKGADADEEDDDADDAGADDADDTDADEDDADGAGDDDDAGEEEDGGEDADDEGGEEDDDEDEDGDDEEDDEGDLDPTFLDAAERHKLPTRFNDIVRTLPKPLQAKAREAFGTRLKEMESGLNRAFQEARRDRRTLATAKAEREWIDQNPIEHILELAEKDPKLFDKLNDELEKLETTAYAEAKKMRRDDAKEKLAKKAEEIEAAETKRAERVDHVTALAKELSKAEGVPFRFVDRALYVAITSSTTGDLTDAQIRRVILEEAKAYRKETGQRKREDRKTYVADKVKEQKAARRRPTGRDRGHAPAPGRIREPKSLEEALTRRVAKMDFGTT
jgi:hypothetical protein